MSWENSIALLGFILEGIPDWFGIAWDKQFFANGLNLAYTILTF